MLINMISKKTKRNILEIAASLLSLILPFGALAQQDNHLSQFNVSPLILNPAMTGMFEGNYRANILYRNQWSSIIKKSYTTENASFDRPKKKFGYGGYIMNNQAGTGKLKALTLAISGAYEITKQSPANFHHITTGLQLGFIHKAINYSALTFDSQYTEANGGGFDQSIPSTELFQNASIFLPEVNCGVLYRYKNEESKFEPYVGFSGLHMTSPVESFLGTKNHLARRYVMHAGSKIKINSLISIEPSFLYMQQTANVHEINTGITGFYFVPEYNTKFLLGVFYRNKDALIIHTGFIYDEYTFRLSYDVNVSSLKAYSGGRGAFEISLIYTKKNAKYVPSF